MTVVNFNEGKNKKKFKNDLAVIGQVIDAFRRTIEMPDDHLAYLFCPFMLHSDELYKAVSNEYRNHLKSFLDVYVGLKENV